MTGRRRRAAHPRAVVLLSAAVLALWAPAGASPAAAAPVETDSSSHLASTWDAPDARVVVRDPAVLTARARVDTVLTSGASAACDLRTTTYTLTWTARAGHLLTAVVTQDDGFGSSWRRVDAATWTMSPSGVVLDSTAPVVRQWFVRGTHRSDPAVCPRDTRTVNHVEVYADGAAPNPGARPVVHAPPRNQLAAVWRWPGDVEVVDPARVEVTQQTYTEVEAPVGPCEAHLTEVDVHVSALGDARIVALGSRSPGAEVQYQNGDSAGFSQGVVAHEWFLTGTTTRSDLCPADTVTQDLLAVYTDQGRRG
jgi:hypothetical protein